MAVFAIVLALDEAKLCRQAHGHIGQKRLLRELRVIDSQGPAFGTSNRAGQAPAFIIPFQY
jgi:hypothetical protein